MPVLVLHDTTEFTYKRDDMAAVGLVSKGSVRKDEHGRPVYFTTCGVCLHSSLAVTLEGLPLGLTAVKFWSRKAFKGRAAKRKSHNAPIEEKESMRWLENLRTDRVAQSRGDREGAMVRTALEDRGLSQDPEIGLPRRTVATQNRSRLTNLLAVFCILSWRVFWLTMTNRIDPDADPELVFTDMELRILDRLVTDKPTAPRQQHLLAHYLIKLARLGGYLARNSDPPPGNETIWRGLARLVDIQLGVIMGAELVGN